MNQLHRAPPGPVGHRHAFAERRRNRGAARKAHAEGLGEGVHRARGAHGVAVPKRGRGGADPVQELRVVDGAFGEEPPAFPHDRSGARELSVPPAVEHRSTGEDDRGQVDRRRSHEHCGRRLVASGRQDDSVDGVAVQHLDKRQVGEVPVERRCRPLPGFLYGMDRKLHGNAAGVADACANAVGEKHVYLVARSEVGTGLGDSDHRLSALQFFLRVLLVEVAFDVEGGHARVVRVVEPFLRAKGLLP